jgi:hypothetical protein
MSVKWAEFVLGASNFETFVGNFGYPQSHLMYRLLVSENVERFLPASLPAPTIRRTYRWGTMWGILESGTWKAEERKQIQTDPYILEEIIPFPNIHAPPPLVDDVWEEEIRRMGDIEYNGAFVSVCLPGGILKKWCSQQSLPVPSVSDSLQTSQPPQPLPSQLPRSSKLPDKKYTTQSYQTHKPHSKPFKPKCFIED